MLSNPLRRFSPYHSIPSSNLISNSNVPSGLDTLGQGSHYALQQLQQHVGVANPHLARAGAPVKQGRHSYGPATRSTSAAGPIRRRISRACDQCNQLRTKCDGQHPCAHCIEFGLGCEYIRERKKRGKASRKDLAQQAAAHAAAAAANQNDLKSPSQDGSSGRSIGSRAEGQPIAVGGQAPDGDKMMNDVGDEATPRDQRSASMDSLTEMVAQQTHMHNHPGAMDGDQMESPTALDLNGYGYARQAMGAHMMGAAVQNPYGAGQGPMPSYPELPYAIQAQSPTTYSANAGPFRMGASPLGAYPMPGEPTSPGWIPMSSPPPQQQQQYQAQPPPQNGYGQAPLRYPVLEPLVPHLGNIIPLSLACDLIDLYFASSSSAQMHPMSPYVLGYIFRKRSFLHPSRPRRCQPALLASILWVAAQTSDASFLTSMPSARGKVCQKLLELTVNLLRPLIHTPSGDASPASSPVMDGAVALGGLGVALPGSISMDALAGETGAFGAAGCLDDVVTYIHLATVVSASEYKGASLRWWNAAWSLARELKLGRELPASMSAPEPDARGGPDADGEGRMRAGLAGAVTDEEREERRRIWWLVYIVDRHLALCYNRPLFLLDVECDGLLQPMDDTDYQNGGFRPHADPGMAASDPEAARFPQRGRGPAFDCTGHSIYGYFMPLMTILGEVVDLHHARNHPRFGVGFRSAREWDDQAAEIARHLEVYERSLKRFQQKHLGTAGPQGYPDDKSDGALAAMADALGGAASDVGTPSVHSAHSAYAGAGRMTESSIQTRIVMAYGNHVMHVLHILLAGKWDPINLLDDNDLWISSQGFITATGHAVAAAEAIGQILEFDPGLEFMPFFFGIYLLQGSFLLLLIADKLQSEASPSVVKACETIIRAHEACVVTLNTEYQRNFSKVMRSALAQVRGRVPEDLGEQHQRRRELLALYRWTPDGTGLAL